MDKTYNSLTDAELIKRVLSSDSFDSLTKAQRNGYITRLRNADNRSRKSASNSQQDSGEIHHEPAQNDQHALCILESIPIIKTTIPKMNISKSTDLVKIENSKSGFIIFIETLKMNCDRKISKIIFLIYKHRI